MGSLCRTFETALSHASTLTDCGRVTALKQLSLRRFSRLLTNALLVAGLFSTWVPPSANADGIYWTSNDLKTGSFSIGHSNLDGTGANQNFIFQPDLPLGVAANGTYLYWTMALLGRISRANLDGSGVIDFFIPGVVTNYPRYITVDQRYIYWTNAGLHSIGRANLDGTGVNQSFISISGFVSPNGIAVDGRYIYWSDNALNTISRANLDGTSAESLISGLDLPGGIAVDERYIYWANYTTNTIGRANLDGTGVDQTFIAGASGPQGVALDGTHIYWTNFTSNTIGRANLDGTGVDQSFISGAASGPGGVAVSTPVPVQIEVEPVVPKDPIVLNSPVPIPVAVLRSSTVDVTQIDATALRFGPHGAAPLATQVIAVDGQKDLLAIFDVQDTGLALGDTRACLQGKIGGEPFQGCDDVVVIMAKNCGVGFELAPILPTLIWLRNHRRRKSP